jgi:hypothetical protein
MYKPMLVDVHVFISTNGVTMVAITRRNGTNWHFNVTKRSVARLASLLLFKPGNFLPNLCGNVGWHYNPLYDEKGD